jgi:hypothetical protein
MISKGFELILKYDSPIKKLILAVHEFLNSVHEFLLPLSEADI